MSVSEFVAELAAETWRQKAACRGKPIEWWFPNRHEKTPARQICAGCPVQKPCLDYALEHDLLGQWAGFTAVELAAIRSGRHDTSAECQIEDAEPVGQLVLF